MVVLLKLLSRMRLFVKNFIIIDQNWTKYTYVALVIKETVSNILYKYPHFCEEIV